MLFKIGVFKNFANFSGKIPVMEFLFNKIQGSGACNFIKNRVQHMSFLVKFVSF